MTGFKFKMHSSCELSQSLCHDDCTINIVTGIIIIIIIIFFIIIFLIPSVVKIPRVKNKVKNSVWS